MRVARYALLGLALLLFPALVSAQVGTISGRVLDDAGEGLPGANVVLRGTTVGAATDVDGNFQFNAPAGRYTLVVTSIGYRRGEQAVTVISGQTTTATFRLAEDALGLDEIVVTGQGAGIERRRLATTVETISPQQIEAIPAQRIDQVLQANLPNSQVRFSSGQPGTASLVRSRGVVTVNSSTTPVIYVDGVRVDNLNSSSATSFGTGGAQSSSLPDIPLENIERIEFVKGGAATTLFGSDAANGVIQIFTKRGSTGRASIGVEAELGSVVATEDYLFYDRSGEALFRPGLTQSYRLSAEGGQGDFSYSFSGRMAQDQGFRLGNDDIRYNLGTTVSARASRVTRYTGTFNFTSNRYTRDQNANSTFGQFGALESGQYGALDTLDAAEFDVIADRVGRVIDNLDQSYDVKRFQTGHTLDFTFLPQLTGRVTAGLDYRVSAERQIQSNAYLIALRNQPAGTNNRGAFQLANRRALNLTLESNLQHNARVGDFSFISTVGGQFFRTEDNQVNYSGQNLTEGAQSVNFTTGTRTSTDFNAYLANFGLYANENLGFKDRYFLEFGVRGDGNTAFGSDVGTQVYPRVGAAYAVSEEPFFRSLIPASAVSLFKLRGAYGAAGNFPQPFAADRTVAVNAYLGTPAVGFNNPGNLDLRPEKVYTAEVGADLAFFRDRLSLESTYYNARTVDALFTAPNVPSSGLLANARNIGEIKNRGFELAATAVLVNTDNFSLRLNGSLNTLTNEVVSTGAAPEFNVGGFTFLGGFVKAGQPVGYLRGNQPSLNPTTGAIDSVKVNAVLGSPLPDQFGNVGLTARYKTLSFTASADYQLGAQGVDVDKVLRFTRGLRGGIPEAAGTNFFDLAGLFVEDTDYFKVRLIALGYDVPRRYLPRLTSRASVGFTVTNPLNFVSSRFDPEVTGAGIAAQGGASGVNVGGFGYGTESSPRQYVFTLRLGF